MGKHLKNSDVSRPQLTECDNTVSQLIQLTETEEELMFQINVLKSKLTTVKDKIDLTHNFILNYMQEKKLKSIVHEDYLITRVTPKTEVVKVNVAITQLPKNFQRTKITIEADKNMIKSTIKQGILIEGCTLEPSAEYLKLTIKDTDIDGNTTD